LVLHARWVKSGDAQSAYTVTFNSAGGSAVASQIVADGDRATRPADPTREGYMFQGWFTENGGRYDFDMPVTGDVLLVAKWT
jgi:uncharacterized repeat protein (TIGR02543 family)